MKDMQCEFNEKEKRGKVRINHIVLVFNVFILAASIILFFTDKQLSMQTLSICSLATVIFSFLLLRSFNIRFTSYAGLYYIYTALSLFGLVILLPLFPNVSNIRSAAKMTFIDTSGLTKAVLISMVGVIAYSIATILIHKRIPVRQESRKQIQDSENKKISSLMVGILLICVLLLGAYLLNNPDLVNNYSERLEDMNMPINHAIIAASIAYVASILYGSSKQMKIATIIFSVFAIMNFLIGNRGEVYYPAFAAIAVYTKRGGHLKTKTVILAAIISLLLISTIRVMRDSGETNIALSSDNFSSITSVTESVAEMGYQIAPTTHTINYIQDTGNYQYGKTYVYSWQYFASRFLSIIPKPNENSPARIKPIMPFKGLGYSYVAESYYNFGIVGVVIFMSLIAYIIYKLIDNTSGNLYRNFFWSTFAIEIMALVRNTTAAVPTYVAWTTIFTIMVFLFNARVGKTKNGKKAIADKE